METIDQLIRDPGGRHHASDWPSPTAPGPTPRWSGPRPSGPPCCSALRRPGPFHVALLLDNVPEYVFWMGGGRPGRGRRGGRQPDPPGRRARPGPRPTPSASSWSPTPAYRDAGRGPRPRAGAAPRTASWSSTTRPGTATRPTAYGALLAARGRQPPPGPGGDGGHRGDPRPAALHLGHLRGPQGLPVQPGPAGPHRRDRGPDVRAHRRRRLLPVHAAVPLQRPDGGVGPGPGRRGDRRAARAVQRLASSSSTSAATGSPTSTTSASPCPTSWPRPSTPTTPTTPCGGASATRRPRPTWPGSPSASGARSRTPTARPRAGRPSSGRPTPPAGALGRALPGTMIVDPETGEECPRAVFDERGRLLNAEEAIGEMVSQTGGTGFEGYWRNAEAEPARAPQRLVLDGRPRLPGRGRLLLLRRPRLRLAAGRRGELRLRSGRGHPPAPPRRACWPRSTPCPTPCRATR